MNTTELLIATRDRIADPACWSRGELARNDVKGRCGVNSDRAVAWSLGGALLLEGFGLFAERVEAVSILKTLAGTDKLSEWNDTHNHTAVMTLLELAILVAATGETMEAEVAVAPV